MGFQIMLFFINLRKISYFIHYNCMFKLLIEFKARENAEIHWFQSGIIYHSQNFTSRKMDRNPFYIMRAKPRARLKKSQNPIWSQTSKTLHSHRSFLSTSPGYSDNCNLAIYTRDVLFSYPLIQRPRISLSPCTDAAGRSGWKRAINERSWIYKLKYEEYDHAATQFFV